MCPNLCCFHRIGVGCQGCTTTKTQTRATSPTRISVRCVVSKAAQQSRFTHCSQFYLIFSPASSQITFQKFDKRFKGASTHFQGPNVLNTTVVRMQEHTHPQSASDHMIDVTSCKLHGHLRDIPMKRPSGVYAFGQPDSEIPFETARARASNKKQKNEK